MRRRRSSRPWVRGPLLYLAGRCFPERSACPLPAAGPARTIARAANPQAQLASQSHPQPWGSADEARFLPLSAGRPVVASLSPAQPRLAGDEHPQDASTAPDARDSLDKGSFGPRPAAYAVVPAPTRRSTGNRHKDCPSPPDTEGALQPRSGYADFAGSAGKSASRPSRVYWGPFQSLRGRNWQ